MLKESVSTRGLQKCQIWLAKQSTTTGNGKRRVAITGKVVVTANERYQKMSAIRTEEVRGTKEKNSMTEIMELGETNDKKFYSLVNHQWQQNSLITSKLKYNDKIAEYDEAIVETWAEYFEDLATPVNQPSFDEMYKPRVEEDNKTLHIYYNSNKEPLTEVNENKVLKCIFSFKIGKAPDDSKR